MRKVHFDFVSFPMQESKSEMVLASKIFNFICTWVKDGFGMGSCHIVFFLGGGEVLIPPYHYFFPLIPPNRVQRTYHFEKDFLRLINYFYIRVELGDTSTG